MRPDAPLPRAQRDLRLRPGPLCLAGVGLAALLPLAACAPAEAERLAPSPAAAAAAAPQLVPTAEFAGVAAAGTDAATLSAGGTALATRAADLRARAASLDGPVIAPADRPRLDPLVP